MRTVARWGYGLWCWLVFTGVVSAALLCAVPAPGLERRRRIARAIARGYFAATGTPLVVRGLERLPPGPCVVVANHASYIDGLVMQAALPPRYAFVVKNDMVRIPLAHLLLRRLGSEFVDRVDRHQGAADVRRVVRTATSGQALAVFPEGTFDERVGVHRFLPGAFTAAARAGLPVVPAAIRGAREVLPCYVWWPRRGRIEVDLLEMLPAAPDSSRAAANALRDAARAAILAALGEPDLAS
jgi:1-acyl-sn-glycerol-3-phosphate acyltransferase